MQDHFECGRNDYLESDTEFIIGAVNDQGQSYDWFNVKLLKDQIPFQ
jgi:hypothetical protein